MPLKREAGRRQTPGFHERERAVAYIGAITPARGTLEVVRAALRTGATVYLAGRVAPAYLRRIRMLDAERVRYLGVVAPPEVANLLDQCRVGLAVLPPTPAYLEAIPSKLFDYLGAGLPCVISDFGNWHADLGAGLEPYAVEPGDHAGLERLLSRLLDDEAAWQGAHDIVRHLSRRYPTADEESTRLIDMYRSALDFS
jgi:glycosyltransferase involved in cell wall biosynthesis